MQRLSREELSKCQEAGARDWIRVPRQDHRSTRVRVELPFPGRGVSCALGAYAAEALESGKDWAQAMVAEILKAR